MKYWYEKGLSPFVPDRVYRDMEKAGLPEPVYRQSDFMLYATLKNKNYGSDASWVSNSVTTPFTGEGDSEGAGEGVQTKVIQFCAIPRTKNEIQEHLGIKSDRYIRQAIIQPLLSNGSLARTIPEKPSSPKQKYVSTKELIQR